MLTIFLRAIILYGVTILTLRAMGKQQLGQFQPYEFALAIMIADLMAAPMGDISTPLLHGVMPVAALFIVHSALTLLSMKSDRFRAVLSGKPSVVVKNGVIDRAELARLCLSMSDLLEGLRESGLLDPKHVGTAIVEADGTISAFPISQQRPVNPADLKLATQYEGLPLPLVLDGKVQRANLQKSGQSEDWLLELLALYNLEPRDALLASLSTTGQMRVQDMRGATLDFEALAPAEVRF